MTAPTSILPQPVQRAAEFRRIPIALIEVGPRQRDLDQAWAAAIAATLPVLGLENPISVYAKPDGFRLITGRHRLEGANLAGWADIPAHVIKLDDRNLEADAVLHETMENLIRGELRALDRMQHLAAAKVAHDALYPNASRDGRRTRADENNLVIFTKFAFTKDIAERTGLNRSHVNRQITAWNNFSPRTRNRLRGSWLTDKQAELLALGSEQDRAQDAILDRLLSEPRQANSVAEALLLIFNKPLPSADERRVQRYSDTLGKMAVEQRDRIFAANEDAVRDYAQRQGWLA